MEHRLNTPAHRVAGLIRSEVARNGIRSASIGDALGLGPGAVSRRLNGWTPFSVDEVGTLASLLGIPAETLGAVLLGPGDEKGPRPKRTSS